MQIFQNTQVQRRRICEFKLLLICYTFIRTFFHKIRKYYNIQFEDTCRRQIDFPKFVMKYTIF